MSIKKNIALSLLAISASSISIYAGATDLTIVNNTNQDSTSYINGSPVCSSYIPYGITRAHSTNGIPEDTIAMACMADTVNCKADVYMTPDCTGPVVATVIFDINQGIKSITPRSSAYQINGGGFYITINGGN